MTTLTTVIPFDGFYESIHSILIDEAVENLFQDENGNSSVPEDFWTAMDYKKASLSYAKLYVEKFVKYFENEHGIKLTSLEFNELDSPKFYNYDTDRIFATLSTKDANELFELAGQEELKEVIKERFTSRDGFCSHYSNNLDEWPKDIENWDHNQIEVLFQTLMPSSQMEIMNEHQEDINYVTEENLSDKCKEILKNTIKINFK